MKTTQEIVNYCYKNSCGNKTQFINLLEKYGYKQGFNGYEICGDCVRVYVGAPDRYIGFGFEGVRE